MAKDLLTLMEEFEEYGYVLHECPKCGEECNPTEIDSENAYCEDCAEFVYVDRIV